MKSLLLLLFFFALRHDGLSQKNNYYTLDVRSFEASEKISLPFSAIKVLDARFDKSNIGCISTIHISKQYEYLNTDKLSKLPVQFPDSLQQYLPRLANKIITLDENSKDTLVFLIKQFRLVDPLFNTVRYELDPKVLLKFSASFFNLRNAQLRKISEVNKLFQAMLPTDEIYRDEVRAKNRLNAFMEIWQGIFFNKQWQAAGDEIPLAVVEDAIKKRYRLPLFTDTVLKVGLYRSFTEFKNNRPFFTNILIKMRSGQLADVIDSLGQPIDKKIIWGVCDGQKQYIIFKNEFCELLRIDNSFRFLSYFWFSDFSSETKSISAPQSNRLPTTPFRLPFRKSFQTDKTLQFFYLNMDEEEIYLEEIFGSSGLKTMQKDVLK